MTTNHQARELLAISQLLSDIALSLTPRNLGAIPKNIEGAAKRLEALALSTRPTVDVEAVSFLLDRLGDFENNLFDDHDAREYHGHVKPAAERVRAALASLGGAIVGEIERELLSFLPDDIEFYRLIRGAKSRKFGDIAKHLDAHFAPVRAAIADAIESGEYRKRSASTPEGIAE